MSVSTKLFSDQIMTRFSQINEEVQLRQTKISTGRDITEASEQPIKAVKLSALEERLTQLGGFQRNVNTAQQRLSLGDTVLASADAILSRLEERIILARSEGSKDISAIRVEVSQMRDELLGLANTRTSDGSALFGGYATDISPFVQDAAGRVQYHGDGGAHTLAASETMRLPTSVNGAEVFMQVETNDGIFSIFDIVDSFDAALATDASTQDNLSSASNTLSLSFSGDRVPRDVSFTLKSKSVEVKILASDVVGGSHELLLQKINEQSPLTGVTATIDSATGRLELSAEEGQKIELSGLQVEGVSFASLNPQFTMTALDGDTSTTMVPEAQRLSNQQAMIKEANAGMALSRTTVGARLARAESQEDILASRELAIETDVNNLGAADLEKIITELQTLLVTRDATRQAYSRIVQGSLFDFLK